MSSIEHDNAKVRVTTDTPASGTEIAVWTLVVLLATLIPGLGIIIAAVLTFTRLRHNRVARWLLLGLSIAIIAYALIGLYGPVGHDSYTGPEQRVN